MRTHKFFKIAMISFSLLLAVTLMFPTPAMAQGITIEDTVAEGEVVDHNLVLSGPVVVMDGVVEGDLLALGDKITINGEVDGNLVVIGNQVALNGPVSGSIYVGAATMVVGPEASVGRDVSFIGGMFETDETSSIARDLNLLTLDANLSGESGRDVNALVGPVRLGLIIYEFIQDQGWLPQARQMDLQLSRRDSLQLGALSMGFGLSSFQSFLPENETNLQPPDQDGAVTNEELMEWAVPNLKNLAALLILGLLAVWLIPAQLTWSGEQARLHPWKALLNGLLVFILGWLISLLAFLLIVALAVFLYWASLPNLGFLLGTTGLMALGLAMSVFWLSIVFFSKIIVAFLAGKLIFQKLLPKYAQSFIGPLITGVILYALLASIPYLGWVVAVLTTFIGLGALWMVISPGEKKAEIETVTVVQPAEDSLGMA